MAKLELTITQQSSPLRATFAISRGSKVTAETVIVSIVDEHGRVGRGECVPYARYGETPDSVENAIREVQIAVEAGLTRRQLQDELPAGAARCAVDCAMWDLEAKQTGIPVWQRAGLSEPVAVPTAVTISLDKPEAMADRARGASGSLLKLKLGEGDNLARIEQVHKARPEARLVVDANEGLDLAGLKTLSQHIAGLGVRLIEQPLPADGDEALAGHAGPIALCADESAHCTADIEHLVRRYDVVNIKLDKTGGLTEALAMAQAARQAGMGVMVGCMVASSLSMAPAVMLAGIADLADLDGPIWLAQDVEHGLNYTGGMVSPPSAALWG